MNGYLEMTYQLPQIQEATQWLLPHLGRHPHVAFSGEVGAGKTTLIKALAAAMGYEGLVDSPTFALVSDYDLPRATIHHIDLYRVKSYAELLDLGWEEYLETGNHVWVEWPETVPEAFHEGFVRVGLHLNHDTEGRRLTVALPSI
jgi:tRNA threonylcarbamoyladenosine biosynthesis protein TsaE